MKSFLEILSETKNTHITHLEDGVYMHGYDGAINAITFAKEVVKALESNTTKSLNLSVKWDGCVHADTIIVTDKGEISISNVVDRMNAGEQFSVLGKDLKETDNPQTDIMVPILANNVSNGLKQWVEIHLENGKTIKLTEDHEVHTQNRGWVRAGELTENDDITEND